MVFYSYGKIYRAIREILVYRKGVLYSLSILRCSKILVSSILTCALVAATGLSGSFASAQSITRFPRPGQSTLSGSNAIEVLQDGKIQKALSNSIYYQRFYEEPVTKGITTYRFERFDPNGWIRGSIMTVDLSDNNIKTDLLYPGSLSQTKTLTQMAKEAGAVAGINGDFFDIGKTNAPLGFTIKDGTLIKSAPTWNQTVGIKQDGLGVIARMLLTGIAVNTARPDVSVVPLTSINGIAPKEGHIILYTPQWGLTARASLMNGTTNYIELLLKDNTVVGILENQTYSGSLASDSLIIAGWGSGADKLRASFTMQDTIDIQYQTDPVASTYRFALSGDVPVVQNGQPISHPSNLQTHPRTAVGFDSTGTKLYAVVVDGRYNGSRGMTYDEIGQFMASIGAYNAVNLDSGGSSQMIARPLGQTTPILANKPSDGKERPVPNGIGFYSTAPAGSLNGFVIKPLDMYVFSGMTRSYTASAYDQYQNPITTPQAWSLSDPSMGFVTEKGVLKALKPGTPDITVSSQGITNKTQIRIVDKPVEIFPSRSLVTINVNLSSSIKIFGRNAAGYQALIEPRDLTLTFDKSHLQITPLTDGSLSIKAIKNNFASRLDIQSGSLSTSIGIITGVQQQKVNSFDNPAQWSFVKHPNEVTGNVSVVSTPDRGTVLRLDYDFTQTGGTRIAYVKPEPTFLALPGEPKKVGFWVFGDQGNNGWLRGNFRDQTGKVYDIDFAAKVNWTGWKYVAATIPTEVKYPILVDRIYLVETDTTKKISGYILIDDLTVELPQLAPLPAANVRVDTMLSNWEKLPTDAPRFAVITKLNPNIDSITAQKVMTILEQLKSSQLDFIIINGGVVLDATMSNYKATKEYLGMTFGPLPIHAVPGRQEASAASMLAFSESFGEDFKQFDLKGTRYILINTATGSLRTTNKSQWYRLLEGIQSAKTDTSIRNLIIIGQTPANISSTLPGSVFEKNESELLQKLLTEVKEETGKQTAYISSGAKAATVKRQNDVPYVDIGSNNFSTAVFGIQPLDSNKDWLKIKFTP